MRLRMWIAGLLCICGAAAPASAAPGDDSPEDAPAEEKAEDDEVSKSDFNADAVYRRPFIVGDSSTSIGGYMEANLLYSREDGVPEGPTFEFRRFNIFIHSAISPRLSFLSELEFEHGTEEIALETAQIDYRIATELQLRFGIILPPIGAFNQNHDAPAWEFVDRPLVSTTIIPATLSEPGGGIHGKFLYEDLGLDYQLYATNGLGAGIVSNATGRTSIPAGKHEEIFEEDNNPSPAVSGRLGLHHFDVGELGLSAYWSRYNRFEVEGEDVAEPRSVTILAVDYQAEIVEILEVRGEVAYALIELPTGAGAELGDRQLGAHLDLVAHVWRPTVFGDQGVLNVNLRAEAVDYNIGTFDSTGESIGDEIYALVPGVSFRPVPETVVRATFRREWHVDLQDNAPAHRGAFQFGVATYF